MRILVLRKAGAQLATSRDQGAGHEFALFPSTVGLLEGSNNQGADRDARLPRPMPEGVVQRFREIDSRSDWHTCIMASMTLACQNSPVAIMLVGEGEVHT
jgi:hypothetical protein